MLRLSHIRLGVAVLAVLLLVAMPVLAAEAKGAVKSVNPTKNELVIDHSGANWTIHLAKDCKVFLNNKQAKLGDLQVNDQATITYEDQGKQHMASVIRAQRK